MAIYSEKEGAVLGAGAGANAGAYADKIARLFHHLVTLKPGKGINR